MSSSLGRRRTRTLREDERHLWERVAESVTPLERKRRRRAAEAELAEAPPEPSLAAPTAPPAAPPAAGKRLAPTPVAEAAPARPTKRGLAGWAKAIHVKHRGANPEAALLPQPPTLAPMDDRTKRRLVRGTMAIDERLDLHGLTQEAAHTVLRRFLVGARDRGARVVLVITGKGTAAGGAAGYGHDRGVLRRAVPHWLGDPSLRGLVIGFEEAHLAHGGSGAIYVRLRRHRDHDGGGR